MSEPVTADTNDCLNCGRPLSGDYCSNCGQQNTEVRRPFLYFLQELLRVVFELDGRAYRTVFYLFTRPGFLTQEYFAGRRAQYTPPLRLFLIISISFFLLVGMVTSLQNMQQNLVIETEPELAAELSTEVSEALTDELADQSIVTIDNGLTFELETDPENGEVVEADLQEIRDVIGNFILPFASDETNSSMQRVISSQVEANIDDLLEDPADFFIGSLEYITFFMLLMMPILALIQRILSVMCGRYYVEHLILTLHNHAFFIVAVFLTMIVGTIVDLGVPVLSALLDYLNVALGIWIFVYLFLSLKFYLQRGYALTAAIFITTSIAYGIVLSIGIAGFALLLFIFS